MDDTMEKQVSQQEIIDVRVVISDMLRGAVKFGWLLALVAVALGVVGALRSISSYTPMYRCEASFTINTPEASGADYSYVFYYDKSTAQQMANTFPYILSSDLLMNHLKEDLGVSRINGVISAAAVADSNLFTLSVVSRNPEDAKKILDAVIANYPQVSTYVLGETVMNMIDPPVLPTQPYNQMEWLTSAVKYTILGVVFGLGVLLLYALLRNTVRREQDIREKLGETCLGVIPQVVFKKRTARVDTSISIHNDRTGYAFRESFRGCAVHLAALMNEKKSKVVGFTATSAEEGTGTVVRNVAMALAENGQKVLLIDGSFEPSSKVRQGTPLGLDDYLANNCTMEDILEYHKREKIWTVSCREQINAQALAANTTQLKRFIREASGQMDCVLVDIPPCDQLSLAMHSIALCDALVYVIRQDHRKIGAIMNGMEDLSQYDVKIWGCILNGSEMGLTGYGYGYGYGYSYGYGRGYGRYGYGGYGGYGEKKNG